MASSSGQLDLRPDSPAYATQLRLITGRIITAVNETIGTEAVRGIRVLPVGATGPNFGRAEPAATATPIHQPPVQTCESASPGYQQALAAHQAARTEPQVDPAIAVAINGQTRALRELSQKALPEPDPSGEPTPITTAQAERRREASTVHAQALRRARLERTLSDTPSAPAPAAGALRTTA